MLASEQYFMPFEILSRDVEISGEKWWRIVSRNSVTEKDLCPCTFSDSTIH